MSFTEYQLPFSPRFLQMVACKAPRRILCGDSRGPERGRHQRLHEVSGGEIRPVPGNLPDALVANGLHASKGTVGASLHRKKA